MLYVATEIKCACSIPGYFSQIYMYIPLCAVVFATLRSTKIKSIIGGTGENTAELFMPMQIKCNQFFNPFLCTRIKNRHTNTRTLEHPVFTQPMLILVRNSQSSSQNYHLFSHEEQSPGIKYNFTNRSDTRRRFEVVICP